jgi:hypothetical protein
MIKATTCTLLLIYIFAIFAFVASGTTHSIEHAIAEHQQAVNEARGLGVFPRPEPGKTYGCWPGIEDASNGCAACNQHHEASSTIVKYYRVFVFCTLQPTNIISDNQYLNFILSNRHRHEQLVQKPQTPPPELFPA